MLSAGQAERRDDFEVAVGVAADVAGPLVGQAASKSGQSSKLVKTFTPSPPSHGTASCARVEQRAEERREEHRPRRR